MPPTQPLPAAAAQLLRPSHALGRSLQRQCLRPRALHTPAKRPGLIAQQLRIGRRYESTASSAANAATANVASVASTTASAGASILRYIYSAGVLLALGFGYLYITDTRASLHQWLVVPTLRLIHYDPEEAHHAGIRYIGALYAFNLHPRERGNKDRDLSDLRVEVFGHTLDNPLGTSAGIDKNADIPSALLALGPAVVEVGGVTPRPQEGNPKPRVFRLPSQNALINRYGLNSLGAAHVATQLRARVRAFAHASGLGLGPASERIVLDGEAQVPPGSLVPGKLLAVQIAKNKATSDSDLAAVAADYVACVQHLGKYADILVVNVSSPNTPGLRDLQATGPLTAILTAVVRAAQATDRKSKPAVMVKVSPDEDSEEQIQGICAAVWASGVDGVIVGNTTTRRPETVPRGYILPVEEARVLGEEVGGYSGPQMFERTLGLVGRYRRKLDRGPVEGVEATATAGRNGEAARESEIEASTKRDAARLKPLTTEAEAASRQPLIKIPDRHFPSDGEPAMEPELELARPESARSAEAAPSTQQQQQQQQQAKVIFATGGITNGEQCLQILNAGASVCQVYTAMMYGGVGTVTRMKGEMREGIRREGGGRER